MPAKKTFASIRVRGATRFDQLPTARGVALPLFKQYCARVEFNESALEVHTFINTLGGQPIWVFTDESRAQLTATLHQAFPLDKTVVSLTIQPLQYATEMIASFYILDQSTLTFFVMDVNGVQNAGGIFFLDLKVFP